ncbi:alpha/beta hydrolase [Shimia sp. NS0008-38b]|uniref:alpha/beta fold hydrolase n=1 Tax=Shimia sp. NS0008-38b TaxID=3127653 RepID=UPI003104B30B
MQVSANGIMLEVETYGPKEGVPLVLIRGLGSQMVHWPVELYEGLAALGYRVVLFDNRDVGLSQRCPRGGVPSRAEEITTLATNGDVMRAAYTLDDMADDVLGVMEALGIAKAHLFGISMGGAITQILCLDHADRVLSATIVMTAARPLVARAQVAEMLPALLAEPVDRDTYVDNWVRDDAIYGSPGFPMSEAELRVQAGLAYERGFDATGINRQVLAVLTAPDRRAGLTSVAVPCQVIHGTDDALIPADLGAEIAGLIPRCDYHAIDGMGHVITPKLAPMMVALVQDFISRRAS